MTQGYDFDKPKVEIPLPYARALVKAADALADALVEPHKNNATVYGEPFVPDRLTFWDGNSGEQSEWFIDVHDEEVWLCLASIKSAANPF